jgi:dTDP-4-amino-4,6-dideoxygalactose transaminase
MTTGGEGGMVTTNDRALWSWMWSYKDHGKSWEAVYERRHPPGFRWVHETFGTNWRMLEVQGALGRLQLRRMADWTARRTAHASRIGETCRRFPVVRVPAVPSDSIHAYYRFYGFVRAELLAPGWSRDRIVEEINRQGVPCFQGACPEVYLEKAFDGTGWRPADRLPVARELGESSLAFLVHPTLADAEIGRTQGAIADVLGRASA